MSAVGFLYVLATRSLAASVKVGTTNRCPKENVKNSSVPRTYFVKVNRPSQRTLFSLILFTAFVLFSSGCTKHSQLIESAKVEVSNGGM